MLSRIKFDIEDLFKEMLDQIPEEVFKSKDTTFVDVEAAGGQSYNAIKRKLLDAGHSEENIKKRVTIFFNNSFEQNYGINKNGVDCNTEVRDILKNPGTKKFDVVIGNPPYQSGNASKGNKLWPKFIVQGYNLTKDKGFFSLVTPTGWSAGGTNIPGGLGIIKDVFKKSQVLSINTDKITEKYFNHIGIEIGYFVLEKKPIYKKTKLILSDGETEVDFKSVDFISPRLNKIDIGITEKIFSNKFGKFEIESFDRKIKKGTVSETQEKTNKNCYKHWVLGGTSTANEAFTYLEYENTPQYKYPKVAFNIGNRYWQPFYDLEGINLAAQGFIIKLSGNETIESLRSVFEHPIFVYISFWYQLQMKGFMKTNIVKAYPKVDISRVWKEEELFALFKLNKKEILHIKDILNANKHI